MAVRISSDASVFRRTASLPPGTSFTLAGWFKFSSVTPARFWGAMGIMNALGGTAGRTIASTTSGSAQLSLEYSNAGGTFVTVPLLTVKADTWYFIALTGAGTAIGTVKGYIRAFNEGAFISVSNTVACNAMVSGALEFGREGFTGEFMDGVGQHFATFDRVLDAAELLKLSYALAAEQPMPDVRNLNTYWRLRGADDIQDRSGNARPATVTVGANAQGYRVWKRPRPTAFSVSSVPGAMSGTAAWTWGQSGTLRGAGALSATVPWTWSQSGTLRGAGALSGSTAWQWNQTGTLAGLGALAGTSAWAWSQSGSLAGAGAMSASASWQWDQSGDLTNATPSSGAISGTAAWSWGQSGALAGSGAMAGSSAWTWSQSASIAGLASIAGNAAWAWGQSGTLRGVGALAGSAPWVWGQSGNLTAAASGAITGTAAWQWDATGDLTSLTPADAPSLGGLRPEGLFYYYEKHRRERKRELEEIEERERETQEIADELDRAIAEEIRFAERKAAKKAETARLQRLADQFAGRINADLSPRVIQAIKAAAERRTFDILQRMQREIMLMRAEEEAVALAVLMLDED